MKYLYLIIICLISVGNMNAQELSKTEKKELLQQIKDLKKNPAKLKKLKENVEVRDLTIEQQTEEINILKNDMQTRNLKIAELSDSLTAMSKKMESKSNGLGSNLNSGTFKPGDAPVDHAGYKYRIQIGVFKNFDITHLFDEPKYIIHEDVNGLHRYSVGNFVTKADAEAFKKELRRLGIKDAFVTTYKDGTRTTDIQPIAQPASVEPEKVVIQPEPVKTGFNVKPKKPAPVQMNTHIESNPFPFQNGTVISSKPVQVNTKQLNDNLNPGTVEEKVEAPVREVVQPVEKVEVKVEEPEVIEEVKEEVKDAKVEERPKVDPPKSSGIKINIGQ